MVNLKALQIKLNWDIYNNLKKIKKRIKKSKLFQY